MTSCDLFDYFSFDLSFEEWRVWKLDLDSKYMDDCIPSAPKLDFWFTKSKNLKENHDQSILCNSRPGVCCDHHVNHWMAPIPTTTISTAIKHWPTIRCQIHITLKFVLFETILPTNHQNRPQCIPEFIWLTLKEINAKKGLAIIYIVHALWNIRVFCSFQYSYHGSYFALPSNTHDS